MYVDVYKVVQCKVRCMLCDGLGKTFPLGEGGAYPTFKCVNIGRTQHTIPFCTQSLILWINSLEGDQFAFFSDPYSCKRSVRASDLIRVFFSFDRLNLFAF